MTVETRTEFVGLQQTLKALRKIDPQYRKDFNTDAKEIVKPLITEAKGKYPTMPLSGMRRAWSQGGRVKFPWDISKVRSGVKFKTSTRRNSSSVLYVTQSDPGAAIFEVAGQANPGVAFNNNLRSRNSRVLWPTAEKHLPQIEQGLSELVKKVMEKVSKEMN